LRTSAQKEGGRFILSPNLLTKRGTLEAVDQWLARRRGLGEKTVLHRGGVIDLRKSRGEGERKKELNHKWGTGSQSFKDPNGNEEKGNANAGSRIDRLSA